MDDWRDINTAPKADLMSSGFESMVGPSIIISDGIHEAKVFWVEQDEIDDGDGGRQIIPEGWLDYDEFDKITWEPTRWKPVEP